MSSGGMEARRVGDARAENNWPTDEHRWTRIRKITSQGLGNFRYLCLSVFYLWAN